MSSAVAASVSDIQLFDVATLKHPYAAYKRLRDNAPVFFEPMLNVHVVTRYDLVREAIRDTKTFSSQFGAFLGAGQQMMFDAAPPEVQAELRRISDQMIVETPTMLTLDEPDHTKYRSLVSKLFTASQIKKSEAAVQAVIDGAIAKILDKGATEFVNEFAASVPLRIIADRLGIPEQDRAFFDVAATSAASALRVTPMTHEAMIRRAQLAVDLQQLLIRVLEMRRVQPQEDMISILASSKLEPEDRHLTHGEALSILSQFLVAGHETTASTFGWGMLALCKWPQLQEKIRGDAGLIKTFVEEVLRVEAPVQGLPRIATRDTELGGYPIKAGQFIMLRFGAANRDERQFENPDVVDVHREKAGMQLAFGSGVHHCIGAPLARQELNLGFATLLARMQNIRLASGYPEPESEPSFILRNVPLLHIEFDKRS